jgi:hypothetical protein
VALQVLPFSAGAHHHMTGSLTLALAEGRKCCCLQGRQRCSRLIEDPDEVLRQRLSYDRLRDLALSPPDSLAFIRDALKEHRS